MEKKNNMRRFLLVAALVLFTSLSLSAQSDTWVKTAGGSSRDYVSDVFVDGSGNAFITGYFTDSILFDGTKLVSEGGNDVYLAKYDANGNFQWVNHYGWKEDDFSRVISMNAMGDILLGGDYQDSTIIGGDTIFSLDTLWYGPYAKTFDIYLVTVDAQTGQNKDWYAGGWFASERLNDVEINDNGDRVFGITWHTNNYFVMGQPGRGFSDGMIITLDSSATGDAQTNNLLYSERNHAWGAHFDTGKEVELIGDSLYVLGGTFQDTCYFRDSTVFGITNFEDDIFLTVHDDTSGWRWFLTGGSEGIDDMTSLDSDPQGNLYLSGVYNGTFQLGGLTTGASSLLDGFVAKVDHDGNPQWLTQVGGMRFDGVEDAKWSANGTVVITGYFQGTMQIGNTVLSAADSLDQDMFVASLDASTGQVNWAWSGGGSGIDQGISVEPDGNYIYVLGTFGSTATIGQQSITSAGSDDIVLFKMTSAGAVAREDEQISVRNLSLYPNPARDAIQIGYELERSADMQVQVMDLQGQVLRSLDLGRHAPGQHRTSVDVNDLASGMYFVRLQTGEAYTTRKLIIAR